MSKLRKFLEDKTGPLKIGTNNGSSFFYIGTVEDLCKNENSYEYELRAWNRKRVHKAEEAFDLVKKHEPTPLAYMEQYEDGDTEGYLKFVGQWFAEYKRKYKTMETRREWFKSLVPLFDREVVKTFTATGFDAGFLIVLVDGTEDGYYWTADEVDKKMKFGTERDKETM